MKPLMIACLAHVDEYIELNANKNGFDIVIESPL